MGSEKYLTDQILALMGASDLRVVRPVWFDEGREHRQLGGTPNHYALHVARLIGYAFGHGTQQDQGWALAEALHLYKQAETLGHYCRAKAIETLTPTHDGWHKIAHAAMRWFARRFGLGDLLARSDGWWGRQLALESVLATPDGRILAPGARQLRRSPSNTVRDTIYQLCARLPLTSQGAARNPRWWEHRYDRGAWIVRKLIQEGDSLLQRRPMPSLAKLALQVELVIETFEGGAKLKYVADWRTALRPIWAVWHDAEGKSIDVLAAAKNGPGGKMPIDVDELRRRAAPITGTRLDSREVYSGRG